MNRTAERILQRGDGLMIRNGKLGALQAIDGPRLEAFNIAAAAEQKTGAEIGRMRIRRHDGRPPYILTVVPARHRAGRLWTPSGHDRTCRPG